jgi:hypothetical protein
VMKRCHDCMTEPTDTLANDCTVASASARNSTSSRQVQDRRRNSADHRMRASLVRCGRREHGSRRQGRQYASYNGRLQNPMSHFSGIPAMRKPEK